MGSSPNVLSPGALGHLAEALRRAGMREIISPKAGLKICTNCYFRFFNCPVYRDIRLPNILNKTFVENHISYVLCVLERPFLSSIRKVQQYEPDECFDKEVVDYCERRYGEEYGKTRT